MPGSDLSISATPANVPKGSDPSDMFEAAETEHHKIAVYEALTAHSEALGRHDVVARLRENLEQEQQTLEEVRRAMQNDGPAAFPSGRPASPGTRHVSVNRAIGPAHRRGGVAVAVP